MKLYDLQSNAFIRRFFFCNQLSSFFLNFAGS